MKLVQVEWIDPQSTEGWRSKEATKGDEPARCFTTGVIIEKTTKTLRIASTVSVDEKGKINGIWNTFALPLGCVVRIRKLKT